MEGLRVKPLWVIQIEATQAALTAALEALKAQPRVTREVWKDGIDIDVAVPHTKLRDAAIAQIEALKGPTP